MGKTGIKKNLIPDLVVGILTFIIGLIIFLFAYKFSFGSLGELFFKKDCAEADPAVSPTPPAVSGQLIHVKRKGEAVKIYPLDQARQLYNNGFLRPSDWGWQEGMTEWKSIADVLNGR